MSGALRPSVTQMARDLIDEVRRQDAADFARKLGEALAAQDPLLACRALLAEVDAAKLK